jgi:NTP pyrophosphatase (non-canonical NTP hydrolase)
MTRRASLPVLEAAVSGFADNREWAQFHDPKNLAMAIASEAGELCGILRWIPNVASDQLAADADFRQRLAEEIGDVGILLLLLCRRLDLQFDKVILEKLEINKCRYPASLSKGSCERPSGRTPR